MTLRSVGGMPAAPTTVVDLLAEQSPRYAGRTSSHVERLRGEILAGFESTGLPPEAVPFVLEELETGRNPSTVAAAGRALRGAATIPGEAPELLVGAIERLRSSDDVVLLEGFPATARGGGPLTALMDLAATLAVLGPRAHRASPALRELLDAEGFSSAVRGGFADALEALDGSATTVDSCCGHQDASESAAPWVVAPPSSTTRTELGHVALENQDGACLTFADAFVGRPSALAFFYTRCMNPEKCSLTVTRLARLALLVADSGIDANVAGMSYDPRFDRPGRLKIYGADRGMAFSARCLLLRTRGPFDPISEAFGLGVGYGPVTVNRHRLDLVVLDASLGISRTFERRLWGEETVLQALCAAPG